MQKTEFGYTDSKGRIYHSESGRPKSADRLRLEKAVTPPQLSELYYREGLRYAATSLKVTPWLLLRVIDDWQIARLGGILVPNAQSRLSQTISIIRRRSVSVLAKELRQSLKNPLPEYYPFISGELQNEHELVLLVNEAVPKELPEMNREDICQDLLVALLEHQIEVCDLKSAVPEFIKREIKQFPTKYRPYLSLDAKPPWGDEDSPTLAEIISEDNIVRHW